MFERRDPAHTGGGARREEMRNERVELNETTTEAGVRRALGIGGSGASAPRVAQQRPEQARRRHRFVENGEVPVVMLGHHGDGEAGPSLRGRIDAAEAALAGERNARAAVERRLSEATGNIQSLQSKLAHAALAHAEALEAERRRSAALEQQLSDLRAAQVQPDAADAPRRVGRPRKAEAEIEIDIDESGDEPQPVSWWLPSYRAQARRR